MLIQVGVGDGKFMEKHIVYDLDIDVHEFIHAVVAFLRKEHYIPGPLGAAINEMIADMVATMLRFRQSLKYGKELGDQLTYEKLMSDRGGVGTFAVIVKGAFRWLSNNLKDPADRKPDAKVHDNAEIVGGAMFDTFKCWISAEVDAYLQKHKSETKESEAKTIALINVLPGVCDRMLANILLAIPILPASNVSFSDWRTALEAADHVNCKGEHRKHIAYGFDLHTIPSTAKF
jgi:hypothetical protein